uniref:SprT-like domain-containing protein n=1 Tax=Meloidogyne incognita TaxID=6306 RepID=A0A914LVF3_MELIC
MPAKTARQIAAKNNQLKIRQKHAVDCFDKDVKWLIENWNEKITVGNRGYFCRDTRLLLNRQVFHSNNQIGHDDMQLEFEFVENEDWENNEDCGQFEHGFGKDKIVMKADWVDVGHKLYGMISHELCHRAAKRIDGIDDADADHKGRYCFWRDSVKKKFDESLLLQLICPSLKLIPNYHFSYFKIIFCLFYYNDVNV